MAPLINNEQIGHTTLIDGFVLAIIVVVTDELEQTIQFSKLQKNFKDV